LATPTLAAPTLINATSGVVPFPVNAYFTASGSSTGSGVWVEGFFEWRVVKSDGSVLDSADRITDTDPIDGATTRYLDVEQRGFNCGYLIRTPGTYKVQYRYTNRDNETCTWVDSSTITLSARSGATIYASGSGSDSNGGTSLVDAKATLSGALAIASAGDEIILESATVLDVSGVTSINLADLYIHSSGATKATLRLTGASTSARLSVGASGDNLVVHNVTVDSSEAGLRTGFAVAGSAATTNICFSDVHFGTLINSCFLFGDTADAQGVVLIKCVQTETIGSYFWFSSDSDFIKFLACSVVGGTTGEHCNRFPGGTFISQDFCDFDYDNAASKNVFRCYATQYVSAYRTAYRNGNCACGNIDLSGQIYADYRFDEVLFRWNTTAAGAGHGMVVYEGGSRIMTHACVMHRTTGTANTNSMWGYNDNAVGGPAGTRTVEDVWHIGCTFILDGSDAAFINTWPMTQEVANMVIRNCAFYVSGSPTRAYFLLKTDTPTGYDWSGNIFHTHGGTTYLRHSPGLTTVSWTNFLLLSWIADTDRETLVFDSSTWKPTTGTAIKTQGNYYNGHLAGINGGKISTSATSVWSGAWQGLAAPASISATNGGGGEADLTWDAVSGASSYEIEYDTIAGEWDTEDAAASNSDTITGLSASEYRFRVRAVDSAGNAGSPSSVATATITTAVYYFINTASGSLTLTTGA
jgi:hypothetical protein